MSNRRAWMNVFASVAITLAACGSDSTAPTRIPDFVVTVNSHLDVGGHTVLINGQNYYSCTIGFDLTVTGGSSGDLMGWTDGEIDYRLTSNGNTSSQFLFDTDLQDWFGANTYYAGTHRTIQRQFAWSGPFTATVLLRYTSVVSLVPRSHTLTIPVSCP